MLYKDILNDVSSEDFLEHLGVKGMKWGHRKQQETSGSNNRSTKKTPKLSNRTKVELGVGAAALVLGVVGARKYKNVSKQLEEMTWRARTYGKDANESRQILDQIRHPGWSSDKAPFQWHIPNMPSK